MIILLLSLLLTALVSATSAPVDPPSADCGLKNKPDDAVVFTFRVDEFCDNEAVHAAGTFTISGHQKLWDFQGTKSENVHLSGKSLYLTYDMERHGKSIRP